MLSTLSLMLVIPAAALCTEGNITSTAAKYSLPGTRPYSPIDWDCIPKFALLISSTNQPTIDVVSTLN